MQLILFKRKQHNKLQARCIQLSEGYRAIAEIRSQQAYHLKQTQHALHHYQQRLVQANRHCHTIRSHMYRTTLTIERLVREDRWVTATEHERLYNMRQECVHRLCAVRGKLDQYQKDIASLQKQVQDHTAKLIGLDRALTTLTQELHSLDHAFKPNTDPDNFSSLPTSGGPYNHHHHHHYQRLKIYPLEHQVK